MKKGSIQGMTCMSADKTLSFIDTNILVYAHDISTGKKHDLACDLIEGLQLNKTGCSSIQVMQEFHVTVTQKIRRPMRIDQSLSILLDLSNWKNHSPVNEDVFSAIAIQQRYKLSYWDAMIVQSALACGCKVIYSEDLSHGQEIAGIKIVNPFLDVD
jgi:predicted nucleic acid-binding protein